MMSDDMDLVREYAANRSDRAFETLVARYVNLVYSAALRQVRHPELAEDITQAVFVILARKAGALTPKTILSGWLYRTARFVSADAVCAEFRRRRREQEAQMEAATVSTQSESLWEQLSPLLDEAMAQLRQKDRDAVLLHFFENKTFKEVGVALGVEERAAQKRVARSVEKLRSVFARQGVAASAASLAALLSSSSVQAAPAHLAVTVATAAGGGAAGGSIPLLAKGGLKLMAWYKAKAALITAAALALATGTTSLAVKAVRSTHDTAPAALQGIWEIPDVQQLAPFGAVPSHIVLKVTLTNGVCQAVMDIPELGVRDCPVSIVAGKNRGVDLQFDPFNSFEGTLDRSGAEIHGWVKYWEGSRLEVLWKRSVHPYTPAPLLTESEYAPSTNSTLQGFWEGYASIRGIPWRQNLKIAEPSPGGFRAEIDCADVGFAHIPLTLTFNKPRVKLGFLGVELEGSLNRDNTQIEGVLARRDGAIPCNFKRVELGAGANVSATPKGDLEGRWQGTRTIRGHRLPCSLCIGRRPDGTLSASAGTERGLASATATVVRYRPPNLRLEWVWLKSSFDGTLEAGKLSGVWKDRLGSSRVVLQRKEPK
jgi:RNA polymerase sigma factor (sigma-70 family)